jgi:hypothetical protein
MKLRLIRIGYVLALAVSFVIASGAGGKFGR